MTVEIILGEAIVLEDDGSEVIKMYEEDEEGVNSNKINKVNELR